MHPEIESTKKPLPPEASAPPQENLASQFSEVLEKAPETGETYNFRESAVLLSQLAREMGIEARVSNETVRKWTTIAIAKIIEPVASLPQEELTSEVFRRKFPDEKTFPLSPTAISSFKGLGLYGCALSIDDLRSILPYGQQAYEKGLNQEFGSAREAIKMFRNKCFSLQEISKIFKGKREYSQGAYQEFAKKLDKLILNGTLPLNNYPALLTRAVGIPQKFFQQELEKEWLETLESYNESKKREKYRPRALIVHFPEEFSSSSRFLKPILEAHGVVFKNKYLPLLTIYFQEKGVEVMTDTYEPTGRTYHILSREAQEDIYRLIEDDQKFKEIIRIANQGFTLEEYTQTYRHRFPDRSPISLTEAVRLAGGPIIFSTKSRLETVKELLRKEGIPLEEKPLTWGKRQTVLTYLPIERLKKVVDILEKANTANPTLFRPIITLEREGKASSLSPLLRQVLPDIKISSMHFPLIYERNLADIEGIYRIKVRTKRGRDVYSYFFLNAKRQEVIKAFQERENEIAQTIEEAKMSRA